MFRTKRFVLLLFLLIALTVCAVLRSLPRRSPPAETAGESSGTAVQTSQTADVTAVPPQTTAAILTEEPDAEVPYVAASRYEEIKEKMRLLQESCEDFIGWLYIADSEMDLPVVQGRDNSYYLSHAPDGSYIGEGTVFLDCSNSPDLSDPHNILFGHNMSKGMFGDIRSYKERQEFDRHRYGWFFTPDQTYRIEFFALSIVSTYDIVYDASADQGEWLQCLYEKAMYTAEPAPERDERIIALSTCASEFANARALFAGRLIPVADASEITLQAE